MTSCFYSKFLVVCKFLREKMGACQKNFDKKPLYHFEKYEAKFKNVGQKIFS